MSLADLQRRLGVPADNRWGPTTEAAVLAALGPGPAVSERIADPRALALIKEFEGFRAETYTDAAGVPTIGYGTTAAAGVGIDPEPGMRITEAEASAYLLKAIDKFSAQIDPGITAPTTPGEYGAMLSLAYNIGPKAFLGSTVLRRFNAGNKAGAADAFLMWNQANGRVLDGLTRRRKAERELFLS